MQTFFTHENPKHTAKILDYKRLGKQRLETKQILTAIRQKKSGDIYMIDKNGRERLRGWINHPCTDMWFDYEDYLCYYGYIMCKEWIRRGYNDSLKPFFKENMTATSYDSMEKPSWVACNKLHTSHRSNLLVKNYDYYRNYFNVPLGIEYVWYGQKP